MSQTITVRLDKELSSWLEKTAERSGVSQGQIVREQLKKAKSDKTDRPFMRLAGVMSGPHDIPSRTIPARESTPIAVFEGDSVPVAPLWDCQWFP